MKRIMLLLSACMLIVSQAVAGNILTVNDTNVPQGGQGVLEIGCEFDTEYTAFELQLALPDGLSLLTDEEGYPIIEKAFDTNHILTSNLLPSNGNYKITCRSMDNLSIPTSGTLFRLTLVADGSLALGSTHAASITASEFTRTEDSNGENLSDVNFTINITEFRTILDETSVVEPVAETNANVRVKRTIKAGNWSTICLPFAMTTEQCKAAFGDDVLLGDFNGYQTTENGNAVTGVTVKFSDATTIEANHPYIIKVSKPISEFTVDGVDINPQVAEINKGTSRKPKSFIGNYIADTNVDYGCLFLSDNKFWYSVGATKIKAFRAYFNFFDLLTNFEENYAEAPIFIMFDNVTGIDNVKHETIVDDCYYNLNGQRVGHPSNGLYIQKGKKMIIKRNR